MGGRWSMAGIYTYAPNSQVEINQRVIRLSTTSCPSTTIKHKTQHPAGSGRIVAGSSQDLKLLLPEPRGRRRIGQDRSGSVRIGQDLRVLEYESS